MTAARNGGEAGPTTGPGRGAPRRGWLQRLRAGLSRSAEKLGGGVARIFAGGRVDAETLDALEDLLIEADLGPGLAAALREEIARVPGGDQGADAVRRHLASAMERILRPVAKPLEPDRTKKPFVVVFVGVNGSGKTTSVGKFAKRFADDGFAVALAACDTFRAAATEQLEIWGRRAEAPVFAAPPGSDPAGLAFRAVEEAGRTGADVLLIDTAGRLHNRADLMAELAKIVRVVRKLDATAPHAVVLVLDATTGQNALSQVEIFRDMVDVTGLVVTKLDGSAKGGILVALADRFGLPVHAIGVGEDVEDLRAFDAAAFAADLVEPAPNSADDGQPT